MKKLLQLSLIMFLSVSLYGQDIELDGNYYFKTSGGYAIYVGEIEDVYVKKFPKKKLLLLDGSTHQGNDIIPVLSGAKVNVVQSDNRYIYFKFLIYNEPSSIREVPDLDGNGDQKKDTLGNYVFKKEVVDEVTLKRSSFYTYNYTIKDKKQKIFKLPIEEFKKMTAIYYNKFRGFSLGGYSVPVRLRKNEDNFEFDTNLSVGGNIIVRLGLSRKQEFSFIDFSFGLAITKVNLNSDNSLIGREGTDFENLNSLSPTAITPTFGVIFNLARRVNLGIYVGVDTISSADDKADWIYNGRPWLGAGININFLGDKDKNITRDLGDQ